MEYETKMKILFMGIFIWLIYLFVFSILEGKGGFVLWLSIGVVSLLISWGVSVTN